MSVVSVSIMKLLRKQKINLRSSTESEIVVVDNALTQCLWSRYFYGGQRYAVEEFEFHQDSMSAMLMENNGK